MAITPGAKKWCINISGAISILTVLGGLFVFLLGYNDRIVRVESAVVQVVEQISGLRGDLAEERTFRREDNQEARALSRLDNAEDRAKTKKNNAEDRVKAQMARELDRDRAANSLRTPKK